MLSSTSSPYSRLYARLLHKLEPRLRGEERLSVVDLARLVSYDPLTGELRWLDRPHIRPCVNARTRSKPAGARSWGYIRITITIDGIETRFLGHRVAWALITGSWPENEIDHKDRDGFNNKWENLRSATSQANKFNVAGWEKKSLPKGVFFDRRRNHYYASCRIDPKTHYLGSFDTAEKAESAYLDFIKTAHGEYSYVS